MSKWWNEDMTDASQLMYQDPSTAFQVATMPQAVLQGQQLADPKAVQKQGENARKKKTGFLGKLGEAFSGAAALVDFGGSKVPGFGVFKNTMHALWYPVDKLASGAYWLYSEAVSQPLTTAFLQAGKASMRGDLGVLANTGEWGSAYEEAEHISPGQAAANFGASTGQAMQEAGVHGFGDALSYAIKNPLVGTGLDEDEKRKYERALYDTDYWRNKVGWGYTAGTGASDFAIGVGIDPTYAAIKGVSKGVKAARSIQIAEPGTKPGLLKTPAEEAVQSKHVNEFFDWAAGRGQAEIAAHPIWGKGRRKNPFSEQYADALAHTSRDEMPLILRFAAQDETAFAHLSTRSQELGLRLARMNESRHFLDSAKFDPEVLAHYVGEEQAGRLGAATEGAIGGTSPTAIPGTYPRITEPPYPRPTTPGPRQQGWDATYGHLVREAATYRGAAGEILKAKSGQQRRFFGDAALDADDLKIAEGWRKGSLDAINAQIQGLSTRQGVYADLLGPNFGKSIEEASAGTSELFGTMKQLYRLGPAAGNVAKMGDKAVRKLGAGRGDWVTEGGVISKVLRNGFYQAPIRFVQTFGERMPQGFVNHNADDATARVGDMLKQVRGITPEARVGMMNEYAAAPDKIAKAKVLDSIHGAIIEHYGQSHNLHSDIVRDISAMTRDGVGATMAKLTGAGPSAQRFSGAQTAEGRFADLAEDGEGLVIMPTAKTQLSQGDALLPVREFERYIDRNSGYLQGYKNFQGKSLDYLTSNVDTISKVWKASTLLRPAYTVRAVSEEAAAAAVKFGMLSSIFSGSKGGANFFRNKAQEVEALIGYGSYVPTTGKGVASQFARISIDDPNIKAIADVHELKTTRIKVSNAWPLVESRINYERGMLEAAEKNLAEATAKGEYTGKFAAAKADHELTIQQYTDYAKEILRVAEDSTGRRLGESTFTYRGEEVGEAFAKTWENPIARDQISSDRVVDFLFAQGESIDMGRLIKTGDWTTIDRSMPNHMQSWLDGVNKQFRQDELYRLVAQDDTLKTAKQWLKTPDGKFHLSHLGAWGRQPDELLTSIKTTLDSYLPRGTGLQEKLGKNEEIYEAELRAAIKEEDFPVVHGEELKALTKRYSKETATRKTNEIISRGYQLLGSIPSDLLVRHPSFNKAYMSRMKESIDHHMAYRSEVGADASITAKEMNQMYEKATKLAKNDIRQVVYDPTRTTATEALRFIYPFLSAHSDSLQRWAGLIGEKPQMLAGVSKIYNAPVAANLVTDDSGSHVGQDGYAEVVSKKLDPKTGKVVETKERKFVPIQERVLHLRLPWDAKGQNEWMQKNVPLGMYGKPIKIQAINTILPGDPWFNPGTGPLVQVPASAIAKKAPVVGDFLQWSKVLPYGPQGSAVDAFAPKYMKAAWDAYTIDDPDNEKYQKAYLDTYNRAVAEHANGGPAVDLKKVKEDAKHFMYLQALTAWASPAQTKETPLTGTPYQLFVDQYKKLQETDPKNAKDIFLATYGPDYFGFTASLSKSLGVAPSIAAMATAGEYKDLIEKDPDMASWIVGDTYNQGSFSSSVYRKQMETLMGGKPMREKVSALDSIRANQVDLGWTQYMQAKGYIDSSLIAAGFHSYQQAGAENFLALKQQMTEQLGAQYPEWDKERGVINTTKIPSRIKFFEQAIKDKRLQSDPMRFDLPALDVYLQSRRYYKQILAQRGGKKLSFGTDGTPQGENADIGYAWKQTQLGIINSNTQFQDVFNRYLENDDLS